MFPRYPCRLLSPFSAHSAGSVASACATPPRTIDIALGGRNYGHYMHYGGNPSVLHTEPVNQFAVWNLTLADPLALFPTTFGVLFLCLRTSFSFRGQRWRGSLEGAQPSDQAEIQGRQSEAQALCSSSGRHQPCQGCLAKAAELRDVMASLELVQVRSRAAVDRCNEQQADLERRRDYTVQLERSLEEAKAEVGRIQVRERGHIHTLRNQREFQQVLSGPRRRTSCALVARLARSVLVNETQKHDAPHLYSIMIESTMLEYGSLV